MAYAPVEPAGAVVLTEGEGRGDQGEVAQATVTPEKNEQCCLFIFLVTPCPLFVSLFVLWWLTRK